MKKISIIIPNYNGEKYILDCLNSNYNNIKGNLEKIEIIVIDDCSTDKSVKMINKFNEKLPLKLIQLDKNMGVSNARNIGIETSTGKYIFFLDSDDYLINNAIDRLIFYTDFQYDIVYFDYETMIKNNKGKVKSIEEYVIKNQYNDDLFKMFLQSYKLNHVWGQLINSDIAKTIRFDISSLMAEDFKYNINLFFNSKKVLLTNEKVIFYRLNSDSITNTKDENKIMKKAIDCVNCYLELFKYNKYEIYNRRIKKRINDEFLKTIFNLYLIREHRFEDYYIKCKKAFNDAAYRNNLQVCNYKWVERQLNKRKHLYKIKITCKNWLDSVKN